MLTSKHIGRHVIIPASMIPNTLEWDVFYVDGDKVVLAVAFVAKNNDKLEVVE